MKNDGHVFTVGELTLVSGVGDYSQATACVMSAAAAIHAIESGEPLQEATDELDCACPVVRALVISRNDSFKTNSERTAWGRRLIPAIIGSRGDRQETARRVLRCADVAVRQILPRALERVGLVDHAAKLRALPGGMSADRLLCAAEVAADAVHTVADDDADALGYTPVHAALDHTVAHAANAADIAADIAAVANIPANATANATASATATARAACTANDYAPIDALIYEFLGIRPTGDPSPGDLARLDTKLVTA